jgi:hypothetical protein
MYRVGEGGGAPERLSESSASRGQLDFSPDGRFLSWVEEGDLWLSSQSTGEVVRAVRIGAPAIGVVPGAR